MSDSRRPLLDGLLLVLLALVAFGPALGNEWIWDDDLYVTRNPHVAAPGGLATIWSEPGQSVQWYPMVFTSFWLEYRLYGLAPFGYHLVNVLLHAASALLLWRLLRRLAVPGAWIAAALFAVHPVMTESVAWVTERKNVLSGLFYLSAAALFLGYVRRGGTAAERAALGAPGEEEGETAPGGGTGLLCGAALLFAAALTSKTVTASLPAALALVLWWKHVRITRLRVLLPLLFMFALGAGMGLYTASQEVGKVGAEGAAWDNDFVERTLVAGRALWFYLGKLLLPVQLVFIYPRWEADKAQLWQFLFPLAALAVPASLWFARRRLGRGPLVAALLFGGTLLPALGFFNVYPHQFSWVADHFQYHASLAVFALLGAVLARLPVLSRLGAPPAADGPLAGGWPGPALLAAGAPLLVLGALSFEQCGIYANEKVLWEDTLERNPQAWLAANNLGTLAMVANDLGQAETYFRQGIAIHGDNDRAHGNLGKLLIQKGIRARSPADRDRFLAEAATELLESVRIQPKIFEPWMALGELEIVRQDFEKAVEYYERSVAVVREHGYPNFEPVPTQMGALAVAYWQAGRFEDADAAFRAELAGAPGNGVIIANYGRFLAEWGRTGRAIEQFQSVLRARPDYLNALVAMAWIRSSHEEQAFRRPQAALRFAQTANQPPNRPVPDSLDVLAAALAATGNFEEAIRAGEQALLGATQMGNNRLVSGLTERLRLYRRGEVFRSPTGLPQD